MGGSRSINVRLATRNEVVKAERFYEENEDENNIGRDIDEISESIHDRLFFCVEDSKTGEWLGVAGVFWLSTRRDLEYGGTFLRKTIRGFGIQKVLLALRIGSCVVSEEVGNDAGLWTAVKPANVRSMKSVKKAGFQPASDPTCALLEPCAKCNSRPAASAERDCCCDFLRLSHEQGRAHVKSLLENTSPANPSLTLDHREEEFTVHISLNQLLIISDEFHREALQDYANGGWPSGDDK